MTSVGPAVARVNRTLVCGAPVANRAWAIPHWIDCLSRQTHRPDRLLFLHSGAVHDQTWTTISEHAKLHGFDALIVHDPSTPHPRHDNQRFRTLARLRNRMLDLAADGLYADRLLSLDTDVMLENPRSIERMLELLDHGADVASIATFLHPAASDPEVDHQRFWAYNAGWWAAPDGAGDERRPWVRPPVDDIDWGQTLSIDVPMAVWCATRQVITTCRYRFHESGEDLGFAQDLDTNDFDCWWDTATRAEHIWQPSHLAAAA